MPEFRVVWEIDIEADSPQQAAKEALDLQRDKDCICNHFTVIDKDGKRTAVDLGYAFEEYLIAAMNTPTTQRRGQFAFNLLHTKRPDIATKLLTSGDLALDPYYLDVRIPKFLTWVGENW